MRALLRRLRDFRRDELGATAIIVAIAGTLLIGLTGFVVDIGRVLAVQRELQASTDAAALAGAYNIPAGTAVTTATNYSSVTGDKNASSTYTATMVSGYPLLKCLTSTGVTCVTVGSQTSANAIQVKQQAIVPMFFAQIFGVNTMTVTSIATASARGGQGQHLSVMIILDATNSMGHPDSGCSISGASRETCALGGVQALLNGLSPSADYVGLMQFPQLSSAPSSGCTLPSNTSYAAGSPATYQVAGLQNSFKASSSSKTLNTSSGIVQAAGGGGSGCTGIGGSPPGGYSTYYSAAISQAQAVLVAFDSSTPAAKGNQNVIIFMSDGGANASQSNMPTGNITGTTTPIYQDQCQQAIAAAKAATAAGTWVYSVAYGSSTATGSGSSGQFDRHCSCAHWDVRAVALSEP